MPNPRAGYLPIVDRPPLALPDGGRLAVWIILNVENWDIEQPMPRTVLPPPQGASLVPDVTNYGWYDYGNRVGFWRLKDIFDKHGVPATVALNGSVCTAYPRLVDESVAAGWEIMGHGYVQRALPLEPDERQAVRQTIDAIRTKTGTPPRGWLGPGLAETHATPDILAAEGIEYVCDWANDDLPYPLKVAGGSLYSVPYTLELNDLPMYVVQHHRSSEILDRTRDQFDTLYRESEQGPRIMAIALHPFVTGVPHRSTYVDQAIDYIKRHPGVLFLTGSQILDWYNSATA